MVISCIFFFAFFVNSQYPWLRIASILYIPICLLERPDGNRHDWLIPMELTERLRKLPWYRWVAQYFPVSLVKTAELAPNRPYLFLYHPRKFVADPVGDSHYCLLSHPQMV